MDRARGFGPRGWGFDSLQAHITFVRRKRTIMKWYLYIARCSDGSLYTGITIDIKRRLFEHNYLASGAKSLVGKRPVSLVYQELYNNRSEALRRESEIKGWRREKN